MAKSIKILARRENSYTRWCEGVKKVLDMAAKGGLQLEQGLLLQAGDVGAGDVVGGGHLALGLGQTAIQTITAANDVGLPGRQQLRHQAADQQAVFLVLQLVQHGVLLAHHVAETQGVAVRAGVQGLVEGDLPLELSLGAEIHEDLIFDTAGGVGGELDLFVGAEGVHGLDETDRADGDQILLVGGLGVVLLEDAP